MLQLNSKTWWETKGRLYEERGDKRDRPQEFKVCARQCVGTVLEIGPATGQFSKYLSPVTQYVGLDYSEFFVGLCRRNFPNRIFIQGDIMEVDESWRNSFDTVCAFQVLEHFDWDDFRKVMANIKLIASKRIVITVPRGIPNERTKEADGHLIGWKDEQDFIKCFSEYGKVDIFRGDHTHICGYLK